MSMTIEETAATGAAIDAALVRRLIASGQRLVRPDVVGLAPVVGGVRGAPLDHLAQNG
jgi:hypothetical protein